MSNFLKLWLLLASVALAGLPLAAPLMAAHHPLATLFVRTFFSRLCHQNPARSFFLEGSPVAVCVRCIGIYCGVAVASLRLYRLSSADRWLGLALFLNVLDVVTESVHWHGNVPVSRFLLGLLIGITAGAVLFSQNFTGWVSVDMGSEVFENNAPSAAGATPPISADFEQGPS